MSFEFDESLAAALVGRYLLVGITYVDSNEKVLEKKQIHGRVIRASMTDGIVLKLEPSGEEFALPPSTESISPADPGEYRLRSTGEVVVDPDFTCTWLVKDPAVH
jgi:hypothetical protein